MPLHKWYGIVLYGLVKQICMATIIIKFSQFISKPTKNEFENQLKQFTKLLLVIIWSDQKSFEKVGLKLFRFADTYDTVLVVGAIKKNHLTQLCLESLATVTKPGI